MSDELHRLQAALRAATPETDPDAKAAAIALAQKNFAARQGSADAARQTIDGPKDRAGFLTGVKTMFHRIGLKPALYATSSLAVAGLGLLVVLPLDDSTPRMRLTAPPVSGIDGGNTEADKVREARRDQLPAEAELALEVAPPPATGQAAPSPAPLAMPRMEKVAPGYGGIVTTSDDAAQMPQDDNERFANAESNPLKIAADEPVSTFSVDVDTASYAYIRAAIMDGRLPNPDAVRIEEMINYFPYDYRAPDGSDAPFATSVALFQTPWNADTKLLRIGIQGEKPAVEGRPALDLVFLIDTSGSMQDANKLPLLKQSFRLLLSKLSPEDRVSIVTYAGSSGVVLEPTAASDEAAILEALNRLEAGGSTAGAEGLQLAYAQAAKMHGDGRIGRILLATDGDFNVGISDPEELKTYIEQKRDGGTYLSVLGFGRGNYNDALMQALAQNGNGTASYIDTLSEAQKVLVDQVSGALFPIASDVKIQIEFNPAQIAEYRLIGYETRLLNREDFNNDKVDAGDIGAGHTVTAIYEITPVGSPAQMSDPLRYGDNSGEAVAVSQEYAFLKLRYKRPGESTSHLITTPISGDESTIDDDARFAAAIAGFGQLLTGGKYLGDWSFGDAIALAGAAKGDDAFGYRAEAIRLMRLAETLSR
ncbi:MAG: VWA domain-containing protein [Rhodobacteraceae bacterium]|nr:VWA domain-containing protein [Paracoccaceae bacterium]